MKIYTRKGDEGKTGLIGGTRVDKDHIRVDAYGTVDELNSWIGMIADGPLPDGRMELLREVQERLFTLGSNLASDPETGRMVLPDLKPEDIELLEKDIDVMENGLEPLKNFVLPGGHEAVSRAHIARCVCRRAERRVISLSRESEVDSLILVYLNRLSDYLFVLSRAISAKLGAEEIPWKPRA